MMLKERPNTCSIQYSDSNGVVKTESLGPKKTRIVLHEYDHLEGLDLYSTGVIHGYKKLRDIYDEGNCDAFYENEKVKGYLF
jgi:peptide deformylase